MDVLPPLPRVPTVSVPNSRTVKLPELPRVPKSFSRKAAYNYLSKMPLAPRSPNVEKVVIENSSPNAALKTYIYLGHGAEMSLRDNAVVPEGCTLSTISETGLNSYVKNSLHLCNVIKSHKNVVLHPTKPANFDKLRHLFHGKHYNKSYFRHAAHLLEGRYKLKNVGEPFKDKYCDFFLSVPDDEQVALFRSGLYEISGPDMDLPTLKRGLIRDTASVNVNPSGLITLDAIRSLYEGSVYPTVDSILSKINERIPDLSTDAVPYKVFEKAVGDCAKDNVSVLMERFRGNHYYFACRGFFRVTPESHIIEEEERKRSHNGNEDIPLPGTTIKGRHKCRRALQSVIDELDVFSNRRQRDVLVGSDTYVVEQLQKYFIKFNSGNPSELDARYVNSTIAKLNEGLANRDFNVKDIDSTLFDFIKDSQKHGAIPFIYADAYTDTIRNIFMDLYKDTLPDATFNEMLHILLKEFNTFLTKKGVVSEKTIVVVNTTIKHMNYGLIHGSLDSYLVDRMLMKYMKQAGIYGATPYINSFNNTIHDIFLDEPETTYEARLDRLKDIFAEFIRTRGQSNREMIDTTIELINNALFYYDYKIDEIDDELLQLIEESHQYGTKEIFRRKPPQISSTVSNGIKYFHLKLKEIFITLYGNSDEDVDDIGAITILLKNRLQDFNMATEPSVALSKRVNTILQMMNDGLNKFEYTIHDVDDGFSKLVEKIIPRADVQFTVPKLNATPSSYFARTVKYTFVQAYHKPGDDMPKMDSAGLGYLIKLFNEFNEGDTAYAEIVNIAIESMNESLKNGEFTVRDMDPILIEVMKESHSHGATILHT